MKAWCLPLHASLSHVKEEWKRSALRWECCESSPVRIDRHEKWKKRCAPLYECPVPVPSPAPDPTNPVPVLGVMKTSTRPRLGWRETRLSGGGEAVLLLPVAPAQWDRVPKVMGASHLSFLQTIRVVAHLSPLPFPIAGGLGCRAGHRSTCGGAALVRRGEVRLAVFAGEGDDRQHIMRRSSGGQISVTPHRICAGTVILPRFSWMVPVRLHFTARRAEWRCGGSRRWLTR